MNQLEQEYMGNDIVLPRHLLEKLGVKPGDIVIVQTRPQLKPLPFSPAEVERRRGILFRTAAAWQDSDLSSFESERQNMWK